MYRYVLATTFFLLAAPYLVSAAESFTNIEVELIYPDNQVLGTEGFFDINTEPNHANSMDLRIHNNSSEPLTLNVEKTNAYTAPNGGIIYELESDNEGSTLLEDAVRLSEYIEAEESLTIPAKESSDLHVHVTAPEMNKGTLLGGIKLIKETQKNNDSSEISAESNTNFSQETANTKTIAIKLNLPDQPASNFLLGKAEYDAAEKKIYFEAINSANHIRENIEGVYTIMDNSGEVLFKGAIENFAMAPMSKTKFQIIPDNDLLEEGMYILMVKGKAGEKEFFAEESFTIASDAILSMSGKKDVEDSRKNKGDISIFAWTSIVMAFILVVVFIYKKRTLTKVI